MPWLSLSISLHHGRFHGLDASGRPEWPPSPARVFQALVAGAANQKALAPEDRDSLGWLERLAPPLIAAPPARSGQKFKHFMPNNDLDTVDGDLRRVAKIRTASKTFCPRIFDPAVPFLYIWQFDRGAERAYRMEVVAERLYQLGRGVDMAWAVSEVIEAEEVDARLASHPGAIFRPNLNGDGLLACPAPGSLASLVERHQKSRTRLKTSIEIASTKKDPAQRKVVGQIYSQPPKARFVIRPYESPPVRLLYELRELTARPGFAAQTLTDTSILAESVRDDAERKLRKTLTDKAEAIARVFIGRNATDADKTARIRIIPLPSIGHAQADRAIRRLLVEVPPDCPLSSKDVAWAFSAVEGVDPATGEVLWNLVAAGERSMLDYYGIDDTGGSLWRTVTPAALPEMAARRRIDPFRQRDSRERKGARERNQEENRAVAAVRQALRHVRVSTDIRSIRVQREPFEARGARAEAFAPGTRFARERLWHVEIDFATLVRGPLLVGDGRYLGLGLMAPVRTPASIHVFMTGTAISSSDAGHVAQALRRAVMARVRDCLRTRPDDGLPLFFCGHEPDGEPAGSGRHEHLFFAVAPGSPARLLIIAPHRVMRRTARQEEVEHLRTLEGALSGFVRLVAGRVGAYDLKQISELLPGDPILGCRRTWESRSLYRPTRHASRDKDTSVAVKQDIVIECERRGLPRPEIELLKLSIGHNGGNPSAGVRLRFAVAVEGPILLGRDSHLGGGLFAAVDDRDDER